MGVVGRPEPRQSSLRGVRVAREPAAARACYDHLAGTLGVGLHDALVAVLHHQLVERRWVAPHPQHRAVTVTDDGARALHDLLGLSPATVGAVAG